MTTINQPPIRVTDLTDTNDRQTDLRQIRQQVADRMGVSTQRVELQLVEGDIQARILPDGDDPAGGTEICLEFTDADDLNRLKAYSTSPVDQLVNFGAGDGTGPIVVGRLMPATQGSGRAFERDTLVPRLQAFLGREFQVPADQIEVRWERNANGESIVAACKQGSDAWRPLEFVNGDEGKVLAGAIKSFGKFLEGEPVTRPASGRSQEEGKGEIGKPFALSQLGQVLPEKVQHQALTLPALTGTREERLDMVKLNLSAQLGVPNDRIVLQDMDGQIRALVLPKSVIDASIKRLAEAWQPEAVTVVQTASSADAQWLQSEVKQSASNLLSQFGVRSENPHFVTIPRIPTDMGRDAAIGAFKDEIKRKLGTGDDNIDIRFNDQGILQAKVRGQDKVYDVRIPDSYTRDWLLGVARDNPTGRLSTFGERTLTNRADLGVSTGYPNTKGATTFSQSLYSRYNHGQWYVGGGVRMTQGLDPSIKDASRHGTFTLQEGRLDLGHRDYLGLGIKYSYRPDGGKFSLEGISSNFATQKLQQFGKDLGKGKTYAVLTTIGAVAAVGTTAYVLSRGKKETKLDAPIDASIFDTGKIKMTAGVRGDIHLGGEQKFGYTFKGAKIGFRENIAAGTVMNQRIEYKHDHDKAQGGNLLNGQFDGTIAYRTGYSLTTSYNTSTGDFVDSRLSLSQSVPLSRGMGLSFSAAGSLNGTGKFHDPSLNAGWSYQRGDVWNFRLNVGTTQDSGGTWRGSASAGVSVNF